MIHPHNKLPPEGYSYIYAAMRGGKVKYVGQTTQSMNGRSSGHFSEAKSEDCNSHWHNALRKYGDEITFHIVALVTSDCAARVERWYKVYYKTASRDGGWNGGYELELSPEYFKANGEKSAFSVTEKSIENWEKQGKNNADKLNKNLSLLDRQKGAEGRNRLNTKEGKEQFLYEMRKAAELIANGSSITDAARNVGLRRRALQQRFARRGVDLFIIRITGKIPDFWKLPSSAN